MMEETSYDPSFKFDFGLGDENQSESTKCLLDLVDALIFRGVPYQLEQIDRAYVSDGAAWLSDSGLLPDGDLLYTYCVRAALDPVCRRLLDVTPAEAEEWGLPSRCAKRCAEALNGLYTAEAFESAGLVSIDANGRASRTCIDLARAEGELAVWLALAEEHLSVFTDFARSVTAFGFSREATLQAAEEPLAELVDAEREMDALVDEIFDDRKAAPATTLADAACEAEKPAGALEGRDERQNREER